MNSVAQRAEASAQTGSWKNLGAWVSLPVVLWLLSWAAINTGPTNIAGFGHDESATLNAVRAAAPLAVFVIGMMALPLAVSRNRSWAEKGFWGYGIFALLACTGAPVWFEQAYWGFAFLGVLLAAEMMMRDAHDRLGAIERLNYLSWALTTGALVTMLIMARDILYDPNSANSAYGLINRFQEAHGYGISRETGLSRMAVVPALISLVLLLNGKGLQKVVSLPVFAGSAYVIWIMQSRGALFSFFGAFLFVLLFSYRRRFSLGTVAVSTLAIAAFVFLLPQSETSEVWMHATRDTGMEGFVTQSGRTEIWASLLAELAKSPLLGYGFQGDRLFEYNAQNALIYALISGGVLGAACFLAAMVSSWRALIKVLPVVARLPDHERLMFLISAALLVFYTLRSIPENSAAVFSVDQLLQYPVMLYLVRLASMIKSPRNEPAKPQLA